MITLDFETKSYADLKKVGTWAYSEHATTDVICACWGVDDGPIQEWWPGKNKTDEMPADLWDAIRTGHLVEAHYVAFERSIWVNVMAKVWVAGAARPREGRMFWSFPILGETGILTQTDRFPQPRRGESH
ncbi:hypothetical protein LCGC14_1391360 [marine sediment metagenome]|uniref:Uncharacterized protein n=1 Tax=marine sediment metagenome TaxID=412755 RepID=A0A0F9JZX4_9ZZZZ